MSKPNAVKAKVCIPQMVRYRFPSGAPLSAETEIPAAAAAALQRCCVCEREPVRRSLLSPSGNGSKSNNESLVETLQTQNIVNVGRSVFPLVRLSAITRELLVLCNCHVH